jgi:RNA polymerase sigma-70 factor (ECF subfamily)
MELHEQTPDSELVTLSLTDRDVFGVLIKRYQDRMYRYIRRISSFSDDLISDILQNTFIKAYINLNSFDANLQFSSWLYRIAHNETISFLRKNKKHIEATLLPDDSMEEFLGDIDIEREHFAKDDSNVLWQAIKSLKREYQDVIVLKYFEHKSYDEISDIIQKPPGTVATWISRAKQDIRKFLVANNYIHHE